MQGRDFSWREREEREVEEGSKALVTMEYKEKERNKESCKNTSSAWVEGLLHL